MKTVAPNMDGVSLVRRPPGLILGAAVAVLLLGVMLFDRAHSTYRHAERSLGGADLALAQARGHEQEAQHNRILLETANSTVEHARRSTVLPRYWGERQINLRQQNMSRDQINTLLQSTARNSMQLLKSDDFELSVTQPDEGLFDVVEGSRQPVLLTLRGSIYFRISERPL